MSRKPNYCSSCGKPVVVREVEGRPRRVCPVCDTVFYENPVPVAAALVLNERREVLLVRRKNEPYRGQWCLPMGFAEMGETIAEAARRELHEEASIEAEVVRLIDADSYTSESYGDLLIVTFEMHKTGGNEQAGDDAAETRYFPIGRHPALPFDSNEKALRICAAAHLEGWAIQDSFVTLQSDEDKILLSDALVMLITDRAEEIAGRWLADLRTKETTAAYRKLPAEALLQRAIGAISQFGRWLKGSEADEEVETFYRGVGQEREEQGFKVHEVLSALALLKKHVWQFARTQGMSERPIDVYRVLELSRRIAVFFDKASYHTARGFDPDAWG